MGDEHAKFNAEWLVALHEKQPILFAARREDLRRAPISIAIEYGGETKLLPAVRKLAERD